MDFPEIDIEKETGYRDWENIWASRGGSHGAWRAGQTGSSRSWQDRGSSEDSWRGGGQHSWGHWSSASEEYSQPRRFPRDPLMQLLQSTESNDEEAARKRKTDISRFSQGPNSPSWRGNRGGSRGNRGDYGNSSTRGNHRNFNWKVQKNMTLHVPPPPPPPLGPLMKLFKAEDLDNKVDEYKDTAVIANAKLLTSFNWMVGKSPTIMIPGKPAAWTPLNRAFPLPSDTGTFYRDTNAAFYPTHPMEPTAVAGLDADPMLPSKTDIVACEATLTHLLRFVRGVDKPFRILVQMVHGTMFLVRRENAPDALLQGVVGFWHSFTKKYTTWEKDVRRSELHQRVIQYTFGGLHLVVSYDADGYLNEDEEDENEDEQKKKNAPISIDDLVQRMDDLKAFDGDAAETKGNPTSAAVVAAKIGLAIRRGGSLVAQDKCLDIKTRSNRKRETEDTVRNEMPRLWVRQMHNMVMAYHVHGAFYDIQVLPTRDAVRDWEQEDDQQLSLRRLAVLLHRLRDAAMAAPGQRLELVQGDGDTVPKGLAGDAMDHMAAEALELQLREQLPDVATALSPEIEELWRLGRGAKPPMTILNRPVDEEEEAWETAQEDLPAPKPETRKSLAGIVAWDNGEFDYTGCSIACGYCGLCTY